MFRKKKKQEQMADRQAPLRPINPKFKERLNEIKGDIYMAQLYSNTTLKPAKVRVDELHDYLDFEIAKADLEIAQQTWESRADPAQLQSAKAWRDQLQKIKDDFPADRTLSSVDFLEKLHHVLWEMFPDGEPPAPPLD
jgi:hypothetical protein